MIEPGVMDQETAYLTLIRTVSSYEVTGEGIMNLKDSNGTAVLMYSRLKMRIIPFFRGMLNYPL